MSVFEHPPRYRAYLLRFWEERGQHADDGEVWRFSLEDLHTQERRGFASLEEVMTFLRQQMKRPPDASAPPGGVVNEWWNE